MTEFTYEPIEFRIPVREGFYHYRQKVSPAYLVTDIGIRWASIVVHRKPGTPRRSVVRLRVCHRWLDRHPDTPSRDAAVQYAIDQIKALGREGYQQALRNSS